MGIISKKTKLLCISKNPSKQLKKFKFGTISYNRRIWRKEQNSTQNIRTQLQLAANISINCTQSVRCANLKVGKTVDYQYQHWTLYLFVCLFSALPAECHMYVSSYQIQSHRRKAVQLNIYFVLGRRSNSTCFQFTEEINIFNL